MNMTGPRRAIVTSVIRPLRGIRFMTRARMRPGACCRLSARGLAIRDFIDVRDAGAALSALALSHVSGPVNIGTGEGITVAELALKLGELSGRPDLVRLGALPDRAGEPPRIVADVEKLREEVGFDGFRTLESGLTDALSFWKSDGKTA